MTLMQAGPMDKSLTIDGRKLAALRARHLMNQEELARAIGVSKGRVSSYETAAGPSRMYLKTFRRLAEVVKLSAEQLREEIGVEEGKPDIVRIDNFPLAAWEYAVAEAQKEGISPVEWIAGEILPPDEFERRRLQSTDTAQPRARGTGRRKRG